MGADHDGAQAFEASDVEKGEEEKRPLLKNGSHSNEPLLAVVPSGDLEPPLGFGYSDKDVVVRYNGKDIVMGWPLYSPGTKFAVAVCVLVADLMGLFDQVQNPAIRQHHQGSWSLLTMNWDTQPASMDAYVKWVSTFYALAMYGLLATIPLLVILGFCYRLVPLSHKETLVVYVDIPLRVMFVIFSITVFDTLGLNCRVEKSYRAVYQPDFTVGMFVGLNAYSLWELYRKYGTSAVKLAELEFVAENVALVLGLHSILSFYVWGSNPGVIAGYLLAHFMYRKIRTARLKLASES